MAISAEASLLAPRGWDFLHDVMEESPTVSLLTGDASFRRYFRVSLRDKSLILMDAPPDKEPIAPFVDIARHLARHGVRTPEIMAARLEQGYLLLEDFGDTTLLAALSQKISPQSLYHAAVETLLTLQTAPVDGRCVAHRRSYDRTLLRSELALFTDWYLEGVLGHVITAGDKERFNACFHRCIDEILRQPTVLVHRDYHSRNLMWCRNGVGVLDFQDAVMGPVIYDLASLLRDCYVAWDASFRREMMRLWLDQAGHLLNDHASWEKFEKDFDMIALQRNLKAIGIFGRLAIRDNKPGYLQDIPRTFGYALETLQRYPELSELYTLITLYGSV